MRDKLIPQQDLQPQRGYSGFEVARSATMFLALECSGMS